MMGFCTNCGNEMNGENFCTKCGTAVQTAPETPLNTENNAPAPKKNIVGIVIAAVAVLAAVLVAILLLPSRSYKAVVKDYIKAITKADAKKIVSLMPDAMVDYIIEDEYDGDKKEMMAELREELEEMVEEAEDEDINLSKISYKIIDAEDLDADEIDDLEDDFDEVNLKIKKAKRLEVKLKTVVDGKEESEKIYMTVGKVGNSWYMLNPGSMIF